MIFSKTLNVHLNHVQEAVEILKRHGLKIKAGKCAFAEPEIRLLGHIVSAAGIRLDPEKTRAITETRPPANRTEPRSFLGLASYYRRFIKGLTKIAAMIHSATSVQVQFYWNSQMQDAFNALKQKLCAPSVLAYPDFRAPIVVETDASSY